MKTSKKKIILNIVSILQIVILISISYAWFSDRSSPSISENNIKVSSAEGLVIKLQPDSEARTTIDLKELLNDWDNFQLSQMSSADGINFYTIDFGAGLANNLPEYKLIHKSTDDLINMERYGCIDYNFYFQTEDIPKHVYFHKDTYLRGTAASAIRVALTFSKSGNSTTYVFGNVEEDGTLAHPYITNAVIAPGEFDYSDLDNELTSNQNVKTFTKYNGGRGESDSEEIDLEKIIFTMEANSTMKVNVKVWLEGGDVNCTNEIADTTIDMLLKFGSANVLRDAPNVFANNALKTITNLTTEMEYSYSNASTATWTKVTNENMTFRNGDVVYVRYSEITGEKSRSYITTVTFNG